MLLPPDTFRRLCLARDLLRQSGPAVPVREIARSAGFSHFYFIRQFDALFGMTPHQFRIAMRLDEARIRLAAGKHSVTDVCMDLGFSSLGSFSSLFARRIGVAPSAYRRRARVMVQVPGLPPPDLFPGCLNLMAMAFRNFGEAPGAAASIQS